MKNHEMPHFCSQIPLNTQAKQIDIKTNTAWINPCSVVLVQDPEAKATCTVDPKSLKLKKVKSTATKIRTTVGNQGIHDKGT